MSGLFDQETFDDTPPPADELGAGFDDPYASEASLLPPRENPSLIGHDEIVQTLLDYINTATMPHALIFAGLKGVGKATTAFHLARYLLKHGIGNSSAVDNQDSLFGGDEEPVKATSLSLSESDPVFIKIANGAHPDLLTIERPMDERKGAQKPHIDVETARQIVPFLRMTSADGGWRVVIIDDADTMNRNAQNAILKILEEPPEKTVLILVAHRAGALIPTVKSRCRTIMFSPLAREGMGDLLRKGDPSLNESEMQTLMVLSDGSAGAALSILNDGGLEMFAALQDHLAAFPDWDWVALHAHGEKIAGKTASPALWQHYMDSLIWIMESCALAKARGQGCLPAPLDQDYIGKILARYPLEQLTQICENLTAHRQQVERSNLDKHQGIFEAFRILTPKKDSK